MLFSCAYSLRVSTSSSNNLRVINLQEQPQKHVNVSTVREIVTSEGNVFDLTEFPTHSMFPDKRGVQQNTILIVYTTAGTERHLDSFCLNMQLLARPSTPLALRSATILVFDNQGISDEDEGLQKRKALPEIFPSPEERKRKYQSCFDVAAGKTKLYVSARNCGYRMGAVQAMDILFQVQLLGGYDWVIHQHPDAFLIAPDVVSHVLETTRAAAISGHMMFGACWAFDWFAFRPDIIDHGAFHHYNTSKLIPECYLKDHVFDGKEVEEILRPCSLEKHRVGGCKGKDPSGIWHSHYPERVRRTVSV